MIELIIAEGLAENYVESLYGKAHIGPWVTNTNWSRDNVKIKNTIYNHLHLFSKSITILKVIPLQSELV